MKVNRNLERTGRCRGLASRAADAFAESRPGRAEYGSGLHYVL